MNPFTYSQQSLYCEQVPLSAITASVGTPCYVYSQKAIIDQFLAFQKAFQNIPHRLHYAVKANSNLAILKLLKEQGCGFDIVSEGELLRVLAAQGQPKDIVFSGVGKTERELLLALTHGIRAIHLESAAELERIVHLARISRVRAPIAIRINPELEIPSHPHISTGGKQHKFGIPAKEVLPLSQYAMQHSCLSLVGITCHLGSQIMALEPFVAALQKLLELYHQLKDVGITLEYLDIGGGFGISQEGDVPSPEDYAQALIPFLKEVPVPLLLEPGRALIAKAGALLARVEYVKKTPEKNFVFLNAGMNDLLRPALYQAIHPIVPLKVAPNVNPAPVELVGPICESADSFGMYQDIYLEQGEECAILLAGAYGFSMSSNYNSRPRPCEILVQGNTFSVIRDREPLESLWTLEKLC